ncbi:MAG TPA: class II fructose-bisphosphate aldolase, partial [Proteiniclasticum sp.]|nr:class II fructose-bisphosphate aldolase [Proteiniclasticum sp.]
SHGAFKFAGEPDLKFHILEEIQKKIPGFPIVLHGASAVSQEHIAMCNEFGGNIKGAQGIPMDMLRKASAMAVCKINMDTDIRLAMTAAIRKAFADKPEAFDPRGYLGAARKEIQALVEKKIVEVLGSENSMN